MGNKTRVRVVKNKVAPPFKSAEFDIIYGEGVSSLGELVDLSVKHNIINKSGSWYSYGDIRVGQGRQAAKQWLAENVDQHDDIKRRVRSALGLHDPDHAGIRPNGAQRSAVPDF